METQKKVHSISRKGGSIASKQAAHSRVNTGPQLAQGSGCTPSKGNDVIRGRTSLKVEAGLGLSSFAGAMPRSENKRSERRTVEGRDSLIVFFSHGWGVYLSL